MGLKFKAKDVDVEVFLDALEIQNVSKATEEEFKFSCPFPGHQHGDEKPSAYMNIDSTAFMCHGCKRSGNAITFLAEFENISIMQATRFLHEYFGGSGSDPDAYSARVELEKLFAEQDEKNRESQELDPELPEDLLDRYLIDWRSVAKADPIPPWGDYIFDRGFTPKTLTSWDIGYDDDSSRIVIPVRDHFGQLIGFKARAWEEGRQPKYLVLGSGEWDRYHVSRNVFGLHRAAAHMAQTGERVLIVVEGELNVIACWQMGIFNVVGVNGSNFSETHKLLVSRFSDKVIVWFDCDNAGYEGTLLVCDTLGPILPVSVVPDHDFDAADAINPSKEADESSVRWLIDNAESETRIRLAAQLESE